jgi:hypothetical protein
MMTFRANVLCGVVVASLVGCGRGPSANLDDASVDGDGAGAGTDALPGDAAGSTDATGAIDAPGTPPIDAFPAVLDVRLDCRNDCVLIANPSMIVVPEGTSFEVNWINVGDTECDVAKIDPFNQVPIIIGLEPGTSYHDTVRKWCGTQFTGTFDFRISICTLPSFIPVDCGG